MSMNHVDAVRRQRGGQQQAAHAVRRFSRPWPAIVGFAFGLIGAHAAVAQPVRVDLELEGRITAIASDSSRGSCKYTITVMGVGVRVPPGTPISSPVADLVFEDLLGETLPGREARGFLGGTAIIVGESVNGVATAHTVFVEPSENVLIGEVTANQQGVLQILGAEVHLINDWRMLGDAATESGFKVDLTSVPIGSFAVAEGYLGTDGIFHAFHIEADGDIVGELPQTSITRAWCVPEGRILVRGSSTTPIGSVDFYDEETSALLGTTLIEPDEDTGIGRYDFDLEIAGDCPLSVRAVNSDGSFAVSEVEDRRCRGCLLPPANDDCVDATPVTIGEVHAFNTLSAATDGVPLLAPLRDLTGAAENTIDRDVWFCLQPTTAENVTLVLSGACFETRMAVYRGCECPTVASPVVTSLNNLCCEQSVLTFSVSPRQSYLIRVGGAPAAAGPGTLQILDGG